MVVALFTVVLGAIGLVSPDTVTAVRRLYFAGPAGLYPAAAVRLAMGLVASAAVLGPERARAILEWEASHPAFLRAGAAAALAAGVFMLFAVRPARAGRHGRTRPEAGF